jgi:hypothetical protein
MNHILINGIMYSDFAMLFTVAFVTTLIMFAGELAAEIRHDWTRKTFTF